MRIMVKSATKEFAQLTNKASNGNGLLPKLLNDPAMAKNTEETLEHLNQTSRKTELLLTKLNDDKGTLGQLSSNPALYNNLNRTLSSLDSLLVDLKSHPSRYVKFSVF